MGMGDFLSTYSLAQVRYYSMPSFSSFHLEMLWGVRLLPPENQITTSKTERGVPIKSKMRLGALIRRNSVPLFWAMHHAPHTTWCLHHAPLSILYQSFLEQAPKKWSMNQVVHEPSGSFKSINPLGWHHR